MSDLTYSRNLASNKVLWIRLQFNKDLLNDSEKEKATALLIFLAICCLDTRDLLSGEEYRTDVMVMDMQFMQAYWFYIMLMPVNFPDVSFPGLYKP